MDTEFFIRNPQAAQQVVGMKLDNLVWSPEINAQRRKEPNQASLVLAPEIPSLWTWED